MDHKTSARGAGCGVYPTTLRLNHSCEALAGTWVGNRYGLWFRAVIDLRFVVEMGWVRLRRWLVDGRIGWDGMGSDEAG